MNIPKQNLQILFGLGLVALLLAASPGKDDGSRQLAAPAIPNPAAYYCASLGYAYEVVQDENGQHGICRFPEGSSCDAWEFLQGKCGQDKNYCAQNGLVTRVATDGQNNFSRDYAVCVTDDGQETGSVTNLMDFKNTLKSPGCREQPPANPSLPESSQTIPLVSEASLQALPASFGWRNYQGGNWMTPVKDQGQCGSCWAFAAVGAVEAAHNLAAGNPNLDLNLSEQYLVSDCTWSGTCCGGSHTGALDYIQYFGIPDEGCLPYVDGAGCSCPAGCSPDCAYHEGACSDATCSDRCPDWSDRLKTITSYLWIPADVNTLKYALVNYGPVAVVMKMDGYWDANNIFRCIDDSPINHSVVVTGYNDSPGYWIGKNSWGTWWGEAGYFKVGYGECSIEQGANLPLIAAAPLLNDEIGGSTPANYYPYRDETNTTTATANPDDPTPACISNSPQATVWYKFTPDMNGRLVLDTYTSSYDTVLAVWSEDLSLVACNDNYNGSQSYLEAQVTTGQTYYIEIGQPNSGTISAAIDSNQGSTGINLQSGGTLVFHLNLVPPDFIFEDDFESCNLSLWNQRQLDGGNLSAGYAPMSGDCAMRAVIDDNNPLFVGDLTPVAEPRYRVRFYFHPNSISMTSGDSHTIFQGYRRSADLVLTVEFRRYSGKYQLRASLKRDDGTWRRTSWYTISNSIHFIELNWWASSSKSASNGGLTVWIDEIQKFTATAVDNDTKRIDKVRLGPSAGIDPGTRGVYYFDRFKSTRGTPIGP